MARNELTKNAREIADLIYHKSGEKTNKELAAVVGISQSQFGRVAGKYTELFAAYLDHIGLTVCDKDSKPISPTQLKALLVLSRDGIANIEDEILGK